MGIMGLSLQAVEGGVGKKKKEKRKNIKKTTIHPTLAAGLFFRFHVYSIAKEPIGIE